MQKGINSYNNTQFNTVDRGKLMMMMFEGGIKFLKQAEIGLTENNLPKFARFLSKAQAIIAELQNTLDFEACPEVAEQLDNLYDFMLFYLTEANIEKNASKITQVSRLLEKISSAFDEVLKSGKVELPAIDSKLPKAPSDSKQAPTKTGFSQSF